MLDKVINNHLDKVDKIEAEIEEDIEKIFKEIDIKALLNDPGIELNEIVEVIKQRIIDKHISSAIKEGIELAKNIEEDGDIKIQDSKDPGLNA